MNKRPGEKQVSEFEKFKELAKNLVAVPKKEVEQQKAAYERDKSKKERPAK